MIREVRDYAKKLKSQQPSPPSLSQGDHLLVGGHDGFVYTVRDIPANSEEVIDMVDGNFANITMDALKERCLNAGTQLGSFDSVVKEKDAQIAALKAQLESATKSSEQFMSAAALADAQRREYRSDNASEVVDGLRLRISKHLSVVSKSVDKGNTENVELLTEVLRNLEDLPEKLENIEKTIL